MILNPGHQHFKIVVVLYPKKPSFLFIMLMSHLYWCVTRRDKKGFSLEFHWALIIKLSFLFVIIHMWCINCQSNNCWVQKIKSYQYNPSEFSWLDYQEITLHASSLGTHIVHLALEFAFVPRYQVAWLLQCLYIVWAPSSFELAFQSKIQPIWHGIRGGFCRQCWVWTQAHATREGGYSIYICLTLVVAMFICSLGTLFLWASFWE